MEVKVAGPASADSPEPEEVSAPDDAPFSDVLPRLLASRGRGAVRLASSKRTGKPPLVDETGGDPDAVILPPPRAPKPTDATAHDCWPYPPCPSRAEAAPPPPAPRRAAAGEAPLQLPDAVRRQMRRDGKKEITAVARVCVSATGEVVAVTLRQSSGYESFDEKIREAMRARSYSPHTANGEAVPACKDVTLRFKE